ncbi:MAG: molybdenum cofactor guanylyltransferase [Chloroflexota bacterium]
MSNRFDTQDLDTIVLAGGASRRMGVPKAFLPLGSTTLIEAVISQLKPIFRQVLVVARDSKGLRDLDAVVLTDQHQERGPLVGLARGLAVSDAPWCFVVGCDMPFLRPEVIRRMALHLSNCDVLALNVAGHFEPLHAFYSQRCLSIAKRLLDGGVTSLQAIFPSCSVGSLEPDMFLDIDPDLLSFRDLDTEDEYHAALRLALPGQEGPAQGLEPLEVSP